MLLLPVYLLWDMKINKFLLFIFVYVLKRFCAVLQSACLIKNNQNIKHSNASNKFKLFSLGISKEQHFFNVFKYLKRMPKNYRLIWAVIDDD